MTDSTFSLLAVTPWHDYLRLLAYLLLAMLGGYALFQQVAVRLGGHAAALGGGSLRKTLVTGLILLGIVPAAAMCLLLAERSAKLRQQRIASQIHATADSVAHDIDQLLDKHAAGIVSAAQAINLTADFASAEAINWLRIFHSVYPDFLTMLATDANGSIVAATSLLSGLPAPVTDLAGQNVKDRPYFQVPMREDGVFISRVFEGRGLGRDPIVAISAALLDNDGTRRGVVEGSLNLRSFARFETDRALLPGSVVLVLDAQQRVIYSSTGAGYAQLESLQDDPLLRLARDAAGGNGFAFQRTSGSSTARLAGALATSASGWTVLIQAPLTDIEKQIAGDYRVGAGLLLLAVVLSWALGDAVLRRLRRATDGLRRTVDNFTLDGNETIVIPVATPVEFVPIFARMKKRSQHLQRTHRRLSASIETGERLSRELTQAIVHKESEIAERTAELEDANRTLEEFSRRDALTGIANRRAFDAFVQRVWRLGAREQTPVALIMIDIDHFKSFNDTQGHQRGDECLRRVAQALQASAARPMDLVARYGGEEFGAVLAATTLEKACVVAERMRRKVAELAVPHPASAAGIVTVSVGVAAAQPLDGVSAEATLALADEALYSAKGAGRNCVAMHTDAGPRRFASPPRDALPAASSG